MSFFEILSRLLIGPLKLIFEIIFSFAYKLTDNPGLSIIILSVIMNFLLLPLYRRADAIQEHSRDVEQKLSRVVSHIKKTFSGDERMMILQTYYRQNDYKPTDALNGSVSLMLEIPFFMAAYQFLSNLQLLEGISLGPVADLSAPDGLIVLGSVTLNALPVLMTLVNVVSSSIYLKDFPLKARIQLYAMALVFLVVLYDSPAGLVLYWTMNNLFSLVKTLFYKLKNPLKVASVGATAAGIGLLYFGLAVSGGSYRVKTLAAAMGVLLQLPLVLVLFGSRLRRLLPQKAPVPDGKIFLLGGLLLTVLTGLLIPSTCIAASPQDFVDLTYYHNPLWYIVSSGCLAAGTFLVWMRVFYWLANDTAKAVMDKLVWILCGVMIINYMFFGTDLGIIRSNLQYEGGLYFTKQELVTNILVVFAAAVALLLFSVKCRRRIPAVLLIVVVAMGSMSALNIVKTANSLKDVEALDRLRNDAVPDFELSTEGKNVVVIMLDRAMGEYAPYIFNERPQLQEQFDGFTYYSNTISFGGATNLAASALYGGYEYTPVEMNKRSETPLVEKHNESLKVMPVLFDRAGFDVTVCDPVYANYRVVSDVSIYNEYPDIDAYVTTGKFGEIEQKEAVIRNNQRNFFCFSIMKSMPLALQGMIYNSGGYNQLDGSPYAGQRSNGLSVAEGILATFMDHFGVLQNLPAMTNISGDDSNTFLLLTNKASHEPMILQTPDYLPAESVDNREYDARNAGRFTVDGVTLKVETELQMGHYHVNMASYIQLGNWFDYLREQGVYDNTRIILVADHGSWQGQLEELLVDDGIGGKHSMEWYFPLLMVKDFDSHGFETSDAFMTNADTPALAVEGLIENPVNPFTGKTISSEEKTAHDQMVMISEGWDVSTNNGNAFLASRWATVKDTIWEKENWSFSKTETVLTEHKLPQ